jgi:hypothetical protein
MPAETCRTCSHWRDLTAVRLAGEHIPRRFGHLVEPGECRLRPGTEFSPAIWDRARRARLRRMRVWVSRQLAAGCADT